MSPRDGRESDLQHRETPPRDVEREREVIVTSDGGGGGSNATTVIVAIVAIVLVVVLGWAMFFQGGDGSVEQGPDVNVDAPQAPDIEIPDEFDVNVNPDGGQDQPAG